MGVEPKLGGFSPKMDGENNGKPYFLMDDLGVPFSETPTSMIFFRKALHSEFFDREHGCAPNVCGLGEEKDSSIRTQSTRLPKKCTRWAPSPVISGVITPVSRVISCNPSYQFIRPFIGVTTLLITSSGPPCIRISYFVKGSKPWLVVL